MTVETKIEFPDGFAALEPFGDWAIQGEKARFAKRIGCTMEELQTFYDVAMGLLPAACEYLEQYKVEDLSPEGVNLLWVCCSLVTVSFAVECWRQPRVPDAGASAIDAVREPAI